MKKIVIVVLAILTSVILSGCVVIYHSGAKVYVATATTKEGQRFIQQYNVKYIAKSFGLFYADIVRWDRKFAIDVKKESGKIEYRPQKEEAISELGLIPKLNWWQGNGKWVVLSLPLFIFVYVVTGNLYDRYKSKRIIARNKAALDFILRVAWSDKIVKPQELNLISFFASKGNFGVKVDSDYIKQAWKGAIQWDLMKKSSKDEKSNLYRTAFLTAMSDGELTKDETALLEEYRREMNISLIDAERIREKVISDISQKDNRVS